MNPPPGSPTGPLWRELPVSRAFLYISFDPSFVSLSISPVNETPLQVPQNGTPMEKEAHFQSLQGPH